MTPQTILGRLPYEFRRYLERPSCPRCGDALLAAESSVLVAHGHIRHAWCCDGCGYAFETAIRLSPAASLMDDL
jgi:transcription elongation factor Elf1